MFSGIGLPELLVILAIVILLFGTKKLGNIGSDLGSAIRNFRKSMKEGEEEHHQQRELDQDKPEGSNGDIKTEDKAGSRHRQNH
ncbi:MAG: Sec-independent protein translocase subunit TatA [Gammaproteobacteria bacterium]|jgi:sec-independent protein translocase protein TatA